MMSLSIAVATLLRTDPGVAALVGARIYPGQIPQNASYPCITYALIDDPSVNSHQGSSGLAEARFQFDCWAKTDDLEAEAVSRAVRLALVGHTDPQLQATRKASERSWPPDPTTLKRRRTLDLICWHAEDQTA
jgi:hypothetical protein